MKSLKSQRETIDEIAATKKNVVQERESIINKKLLPTNGVIMSKRKLPIEDYFTRLKTTSIHNIKFAESVDVLLNLLEIEAE